MGDRIAVEGSMPDRSVVRLTVWTAGPRPDVAFHDGVKAALLAALRVLYPYCPCPPCLCTHLLAMHRDHGRCALCGCTSFDPWHGETFEGVHDEHETPGAGPADADRPDHSAVDSTDTGRPASAGPDAEPGPVDAAAGGGES